MFLQANLFCRRPKNRSLKMRSRGHSALTSARPDLVQPSNQRPRDSLPVQGLPPAPVGARQRRLRNHPARRQTQRACSKTDVSRHALHLAPALASASGGSRPPPPHPWLDACIFLFSFFPLILTVSPTSNSPAKEMERCQGVGTVRADASKQGWLMGDRSRGGARRVRPPAR